jgi:hypothetical protein
MYQHLDLAFQAHVNGMPRVNIGSQYIYDSTIYIYIADAIRNLHRFHVEYIREKHVYFISL